MKFFAFFAPLPKTNFKPLITKELIMSNQDKGPISNSLKPGVGIVVGVVIGVALGAALDNMGTGIAIGIALGAAFEIARNQSQKKK